MGEIKKGAHSFKGEGLQVLLQYPPDIINGEELAKVATFGLQQVAIFIH